MSQQSFEREIHLRDYLRVLQKRFWAIVAFFVVCVAAGAWTASRYLPTYRASARIQIDRDTPNVLDVQEVVKPDQGFYGEEYYKTQYELLRSRSLALEVIRRLQLDKRPEFVRGPRPKPGPVALVVNAARDLFGSRPPEPVVTTGLERLTEDVVTTTLVNRFLGMTSVVPVRNTQLVDLTSVTGDAKLAADLANALADVFIERSMRQRKTTTREASTWLIQQLEEARQKVEQSEMALQQYKERNDIVSLENKQNIVVQKLEDLNSTLTGAKTQRIALETRYLQLQKMTSPQEILESLPEIGTTPVIAQLRAESNRLQNELSAQSKTLTPRHPKIINLKNQIESLDDRIKEEVAKVSKSMRNDFEVAIAKEKSLQEAVTQQKRETQTLSQKSIQYGVLEREVENNRRIYEILLNRTKETGLVEGLQTGNIRLVDRAEVPLGPRGPGKGRTMTLAVIVGLMGGLGLAFFMEYLDDSIKDPDDLEQYVNLPFLAPIPLIRPRHKHTALELIAEKEPKSSTAEAYRSARTSIMFSSPDAPPVSILVTSSGPEEGKTTTSVNLAITMAHAGNRVLLMDADLRKPRLHGIFKVANTFGLTNLLTASTDINAALNRTAIANLTVVTSGPIPPNPSELLGSQRMKKLLESLRGHYDRIIIDCPPIIAVTDASVLAAQVDGVVLVVKVGQTSRLIIRRAQKKLEEVRARVLGVILNAFNVRKHRYYYSPRYYYAYYGNDRDKKPKKG